MVFILTLLNVDQIHCIFLKAVAQTSVSRKKVIDAYPESSKADFFAQRIFDHSVIQNHYIAICCELRIPVKATFV